MAQVAISLAIAGATTAAQLLLAPKPKKPAPIDRGKLDDARFSIPALGAGIPKGWGTFRCAPIWIDHTPTLHTVEVTEGQSGGKGGGGTPPTPDERKHIYTKSVIGVFHNGLLHKGVSKMWCGEKLVYNADLSRNEADTSATRYEAELGVLAGGASVTAQAECSGGFKVTGLGSGGNVTFNVDVDAAGDYEIAAFYTSTVDRTFKVSVNGGSLNDLVCPASGGASVVTSEVIVLTLLNGANTIKFENSGAACPDLDRIDIAPVLVFTPEGDDPRGFTGITRPGRFGPDNPDYAWPVANEAPLFSETAGGVTNGGFYQAVLSEWGNPTIRFYNGSELQEPDPITIALRGLSNSPAYRGFGIIAIENIQLQNGQMPNVTLEVQEGTREVPAIVNDLYKEVNVAAADIDVTALQGLLLGDASGFDPGTYSAITWTGLNNATQTAGGAITKTSGTNNTWNAYANSGDSVSNGSDASIRFTAGAAGTYMLGFAYTTTPGSALPHPYDQVPFTVILNKNSNPSQEAKNAIQLSLGGDNNSYDVGVWSPGDKFQVEYRNGRFACYQNGLMLTGYTPPVPSTFPLKPIFMGYATGGGPSAATFATGTNIGTDPIIANGGGLFMESPGPAADMLAALMLRFQFSMPEVDGKPKAVLNNASSDLTIPYTELRAHRGDDMPKEDMIISRVDPLKLAKRTTVTYSDPAYSYHTRTQSEVRLFGPQQGVSDITLPMIETAQNMKNLAIIISNREEIEGQTYRFTLGPKYMRIHQGTVLTINSRSGVAHTVRVKELGLELPAGIVDVEAVRQDASVFSANGTPADISIESPIVALPGNTRAVLIDGTLLRPTDAGDGTEIALYLGLCGRGSGAWPGGFLYREFPKGSDNYILVQALDKPAGIGVTTNTLASVANANIWDTASTITIQFHSNTLLESVTQAELLTDPQLNLLAVINPSDGETEYIQFANVTALTATAPYITKYSVDTLLRGRAMTEYNIGHHTSADVVVLINSAVMPVRFNIADLAQAVNFKAVTVGMGVDIAPAFSQTIEGRSLKEAAPTNASGTRDSANDLLIEFLGRTRIGGGLRSNQSGAVNSETEEYRVQPVGTNRVIPVVPGVAMAAMLEGDGATKYTNVTHGTLSASLAFAVVTARSMQRIEQTGNFIEATLSVSRVDPSDVNAAIAVVPSSTEWRQHIFPDLPSVLHLTDICPLSVILANTGSGPQVQVNEFDTVKLAAFDTAAEVRVHITFSGTEMRVSLAWAGQGTPAVYRSSNVPDFPLHALAFIRSENTDNSAAVSKITMTTAPFPKTIYAADQQTEDGFTPGNSIQFDIWQYSRLTGDGNKLRVTL